jgi:hypothetical protein
VALFRKSRWFTRGWTLQELIASRKQIFYSSQWEPLGPKSDMLELLYDITKIDIPVLERSDNVSSFSVARRMYWASHRETAREEDMAYCLLGIFHANMPLIYGEGISKAFGRLQDEILRGTTYDESLFAWDTGSKNKFLADSPKQFQQSGTISSIPFNRIQSRPVNLGQGRAITFTMAQPYDPSTEILEESAYELIILDCQIGPIPGRCPAFPVFYSKESKRVRFYGSMAVVAFSNPAAAVDYAGLSPSSIEPFNRCRDAIIQKPIAVPGIGEYTTTLRYPRLERVPILIDDVHGDSVLTGFLGDYVLWVDLPSALQSQSGLKVSYHSSYPSKFWEASTSQLYLLSFPFSLHVIQLHVMREGKTEVLSVLLNCFETDTAFSWSSPSSYVVDMFNKQWKVGCIVIKEGAHPKSASSRFLKEQKERRAEVFGESFKCEELGIVIKIRPIESTNFVRIRMGVEVEG